ncbi:MAG: hypothetical protein WC613_00445 [Candidatus Aenigmatarchaeota archaeon]
MYKTKNLSFDPKEIVEENQPSYRPIVTSSDGTKEPYFALKSIDTKKREANVE